MLAKARNIRVVFQEFIEKTLKQKKRILRLSREFGWIILGQGASVAGSLALVRVLTGYLDPVEYGQLALGLTVATLVNQVVMGGLLAGIGRFFSIANERGDLWGYLLAARRMLIMATAVVVGLGGVVISGLGFAGMTHGAGLATAAVGLSLISSYNSALNGIQNAARQRAIVALHGGMDAWLKIGLAVGAMLLLGQNSTAVVVGFMLSACIITLSQFFLFRRSVAKKENPSPQMSDADWTRQMWSYSWPFSIWGIFTWIQISSDRWALERFSTTSEVGQYAVLYQLGYTPIFMVAGMAVTFLGPILFQRSNPSSDGVTRQSAHNLSWKTVYLALGCTVLGFMVTVVCHRWIFELLVAEPFHGVSYLLPWVVLAGGLFSAAQMLALKLMAEMRIRKLLVVKVVTALLGVGANVLAAWLFGISGVVIGILFFSLIYFSWVTFLSARPYVLGKLNPL